MLIKNNTLFKNYHNKNKYTKIYIANNKSNQNIILDILKKYLLFLNKFNIKNKVHNKNILGLDFEFNTGVIAMAQLNLDLFKIDNHDVILLFNPSLPIYTKIFYQIITHKNNWVILHGGESLDVPFLTKQIITKKNQQKLFFQNLIDTKNICDYTILNKQNQRCKINYFLFQQNIITSQFLQKMLINEKNMGPIQNVHVDVNNLSNELLLYSAYDVIFLPDLVKQLFISTPLIQINQLTQISYLIKFDLFTQFNKTKQFILQNNNSYLPSLHNEYNKLNNILYLNFYSHNNLLQKFIQIEALKKIIDILLKSYFIPLLIKYTNIIHTNNNFKKIKPIPLPKEIKSLFLQFSNHFSSLFI